MNIILPYMGRWTSLYVNCSGLLPFHDVLGITRWENRDTVSQEIRSLQVSMLVGEAPRLQHLAIIAECHVADHGSQIPIPMAMPCLRTVEVDGIDIDRKCFEKASEAIVNFTILTRHLLDFQALRKLKLKGPRTYLSIIPSASILPTLQHLIIDKSILHDLLRVCMPALCTLQVLRGETCQSERQRVQYPSLQSLRTFIYGSNHPPSTPFLFHILALMPMVTKIVFDGGVPSDAFFWSWATTHREMICPRLEKLIFHNAFGDPTLAVNVFVQVNQKYVRIMSASC